MLDRVLLEVELLSRTYDQTTELNALCLTARRIANACHKCIQNFLDKTKKYENSLSMGKAGHHIRDFSMKIRWHFAHSDELDKFRAEINAHCSSMNMLLITASV